MKSKKTRQILPRITERVWVVELRSVSYITTGEQELLSKRHPFANGGSWPGSTWYWLLFPLLFFFLLNHLEDTNVQQRRSVLYGKPARHLSLSFSPPFFQFFFLTLRESRKIPFVYSVQKRKKKWEKWSRCNEVNEMGLKSRNVTCLLANLTIGEDKNWYRLGSAIYVRLSWKLAGIG